MIVRLLFAVFGVVMMSLPFDPEFAAGFEGAMNGGVYAVYRPGQALSEPVDGFLQLLRQIHYE